MASNRRENEGLVVGMDVMDDILSAGDIKPREVSWHGRMLDYAIARIKVGKRLRPLGDVATLAESMRQIGQLNPINILPDGTLVAGYHRLEAARLLGWDTIRAIVVEMDEVDAELAEIDENLRRSNLTVLEESEHLLRREELLEAKGIRAKQGDNRFSIDRGDTVSPLSTTTSDIADSLGMTERSAQRRLQIAKNLDADAKAAIRTNEEIANSTTQLLELSRQPAERQRTIADMLVSGQASNVNDAVRLLTPTPAPTPVKVEYRTPPPADVSPELPTYAQIYELESVIRGLDCNSPGLRYAARNPDQHWLWGRARDACDSRSLRWRKSDLIQALNNVAAQMEAKEFGTNRPNVGTDGSVPAAVAAEPIYAEIHVLAGLIRGFRCDAENLRAAIAEGEANATYVKITEIMKSARVHWREDDLLVAIHTIAGEVEAREMADKSVFDPAQAAKNAARREAAFDLIELYRGTLRTEAQYSELTGDFMGTVPVVEGLRKMIAGLERLIEALQ